MESSKQPRISNSVLYFKCCRGRDKGAVQLNEFSLVVTQKLSFLK